MSFRRRAAVAALLSAALVAQLPPGTSEAAALRAAPPTQLPHRARVSLTPPVPIPVKEPFRAKHAHPSAAALRPSTLRGTRAHGIQANGPPMLRPNEIDRVIAAASRRASGLKAAARSGRDLPQPLAIGPRPGTRRAMSLPSDPTASGTGVKPWWQYKPVSMPGTDRVNVNVGTGNVLLQADDMAVPHKGVPMAFRRTYNSQSGHDVNATDAAGFVYEPAGMYGNGWTNTSMRTSPEMRPRRCTRSSTGAVRATTTTRRGPLEIPTECSRRARKPRHPRIRRRLRVSVDEEVGDELLSLRARPACDVSANRRFDGRVYRPAVPNRRSKPQYIPHAQLLVGRRRLVADGKNQPDHREKRVRHDRYVGVR